MISGFPVFDSGVDAFIISEDGFRSVILDSVAHKRKEIHEPASEVRLRSVSLDRPTS
jgi:hypothetical protein